MATDRMVRTMMAWSGNDGAVGEWLEATIRPKTGDQEKRKGPLLL